MLNENEFAQARRQWVAPFRQELGRNGDVSSRAGTEIRTAMASQPVVIVTGASAGVGRAVALRFGAAGCRVGLIARDGAALAATRAEIEQLGGTASAAAGDVADPAAVFAAADRLEQELGPVDIWINDAMETVFSRVADMTPEEFRRVTEVTYLGFVYGTMAALRSMRPRGRGRIIQMGSALAYRGIPLQAAYCGAKHAIRGFTDSLRTELINEGSRIKVTIVDLPAVNTPQFDWARVHVGRTPRPMGAPIQPEVVADAVFRAAHGPWREYWLGAPTLLTILGNTVLPGYLDRYLAKKGVEGQQTPMPVQPDRQDNLDRAVPALHRTRGSFSAEAGSSAPLIPGEIGRIGAVAAGALVFFSLGALFGARAKPRQGRRT
jgi:NAD(P)-dependent dehydrogenase (short-subunit alcohol dehydrogenase family)